MKLFLLVFVTILSFSAFSADDSNGNIKGFVEIKQGTKLYIDYAPAQDGAPTIVLLHGLTYSTRQWEKMSVTLAKLGYGVLRFDFRGMGETLKKYAPVLEPISYKTQVDDVKLLLAKLGIEKPYNLVGLSYGGGIAMAFAAQYPQLVKNLIVMAPYTQPLQQQHDWIMSQIWYTRKTFPMNPASDDDLYEYFLRQIVYTTYPAAEPVVLENPFKLEAIFNLIVGIRKWTADMAVKLLPQRSLHLMIAGRDQYVPRDVMEKFWDSVPNSARATKLVVNNSEHKIPEAVPNFAAAWIDQIMIENKILSGGREFEADPFTGVVKYEGGSFKILKDK